MALTTAWRRFRCILALLRFRRNAILAYTKSPSVYGKTNLIINSEDFSNARTNLLVNDAAWDMPWTFPPYTKDTSDE